MTDPGDSLQSYVRAALALQGYTFSDPRVAEITLQFARIAAIAATLMPAEPALNDVFDSGSAPVFRP
jgi:hypothetical protein